MPTKRFREVRLLLKSRLAKPVNLGSQTIGVTARKDN
jgi:hypothetical protein